MGFKIKGGGGPKTAATHISHDQAARLFREAIEYVTKSDIAANVYGAVDRLSQDVTVNVYGGAEDQYMPVQLGGPYIDWDPLSAMQVSVGGWQSPAVGVIHEIYHAYQDLVLKDIYTQNGAFVLRKARGFNGQEEMVPAAEIPTVAFEASVVEQLQKLGHRNETKRTSYIRNVGTQAVKSVTSTGR